MPIPFRGGVARVFALALLLILFTGVQAGAANGNSTRIDGDKPERTADSIGQIWAARADDISAIVANSSDLQAYAESLAGPLAADVQSARANFTRLSSLYHASRGHPTEQLTLVEQMRNQRKRLKARMAPLEDIAGVIAGRLGEIDALQKDMNDIDRQNREEGVDVRASTPEADGLKSHGRVLADARRALSPAVARLEGILAPGRLTLERFDRTVADIEAGLVSVWENYYLTASDNSLDAVFSIPALLTDWVTSLGPRTSFAWPQSGREWGDAFKSFFLAAVFMAALGFFALRGGRTLPRRWRHAVEGVIKSSWIWAGIGLSILTASTNRHGGIYFAFSLAGCLIIIAGVAALSWRLRVAVAPSLEDKPSPLARLYPPAAIGVLMLFSDLPTRILGFVWGLVMLVFVVMIFSMNRSHKSEGDLPLLERFSYGCAFWFGIALLLVAAFGYARLAILVFMLLFALVNTIILANAVMALFNLLVDRFFDKKAQPVRNAVAQALSVPLAWVLSLLCTLPWVWAVPGAYYLAGHAMEANYTVGDASFDISRVLFIVLLFFLARSFITLGSTSLEHLPERVPSFERGVIPPLRNLLTYGLWALFGIFALGMLGVNFTSLAVVAGGLSVGIGFGMQNIFNNLVSGLLLIFGRTILVGDYVEVAGAAGTVREISIRSTTIETPERAVVYVPNSSIMSGQFVNWTRNSRVVRRSLNIGIAYGADTALAAKLLLEAARDQAHVLPFPKPAVFFNNFGDSALDFTLNVFIDDFDNVTSALSELRFTVERLFDQHGVDIPFPQLTLHMQDKAAPALPGGAPADMEKNAATSGTGDANA
ncbi:MAG: mechanosensitive ion channel [Desulfovibrio sp.]|jgi:small-conductance mechanosensitive channel|nr:mechanosensitive ion channel [Desulfovibrio sp.]